MGEMRKAERKWGDLWHIFGQADKQGLKVNLIESVRNNSRGHFDLGEWFNTHLVPFGVLKCIRDRRNSSYNFDLIWDKHTIENTEQIGTVKNIRDRR